MLTFTKNAPQMAIMQLGGVVVENFFVGAPVTRNFA